LSRTIQVLGYAKHGFQELAWKPLRSLRLLLFNFHSSAPGRIGISTEADEGNEADSSVQAPKERHVYGNRCSKKPLSRNNSIQPQMNADERRWKRANTKNRQAQAQSPNGGCGRADETTLIVSLSASICVYLRFQLHGSGLFKKGRVDL
jgi:hypothetical protein